MSRKIMSVMTIAAFVVMSSRCTHLVERSGIELSGKSRPTADIIAVQLKSGKAIDFPQGSRASVQGDAVVGRILKKDEIPRNEIKYEKRDDRNQIVELGTTDGTRYIMTRATSDSDKVVGLANVPISIPLSDVQIVWVKQVNVFPTVMVSCLVIAGVALIILAATSGGGSSYTPPPSDVESCPFIYSYDGSQYVLDAEPYGAAICQGMKRTEWTPLDNLREVGGRYKVLLSNELNETQYTDELKLIAIDHPEGVRVVPDTAGRIHTFAAPLAPLRAFDQKGRDILPLVSQNDRLYWVSRIEEKDPEQKEGLRDDLVFEFPKPAGANQAKLLVNAWTTMWGSRVARDFLEARGTSLPAWYADVNSHGPSYSAIMNWHMTEELYMLRVLVETKDGWKARALINGGGPYIAKDKVYVLDVSDVAGETLKIKLRPPVNFWMLNQLAVDYTADLPVRTTELAAASAIDRVGQDVRMKLESADNDYLAAPNRGDRTEITFPVPPHSQGLARTVLLKVTGYYEIRLIASGEPQREIVDKIMNEPGFAAQFALKKYLKWEAGVLADKR